MVTLLARVEMSMGGAEKQNTIDKETLVKDYFKYTTH